MKIRQCFLELRLKMSFLLAVFFLILCIYCKLVLQWDVFFCDTVYKTCSVEFYWHCSSDKTVSNKSNKAVNFCCFSCATTSPITVIYELCFLHYITSLSYKPHSQEMQWSLKQVCSGRAEQGSRVGHHGVKLADHWTRVLSHESDCSQLNRTQHAVLWAASVISARDYVHWLTTVA